MGTFVESVKYEADITDISDKLKTLEGKQEDLEETTDETTGKMGGAWDKLKGGLGKAGDAFKGIATGIGAVVGIAAVFGPKILGAGAELEAMDTKAKTVFSDGSLSKVKSWADAVAASMGLTESKAVGLAAGIGDLLKPMGFSADEAAGMSTKLVDLSGALSAWSGGTVDAAGVSDILTKALLGETDGLKQLGISISAAEVEARLAVKGQQDLTGAALAQAKAMATQELIIEKSTDAQKAWTDGSMDAIKQQNEAKASMATLGETINRILYPILQAILPPLQAVAEWLGVHLPPAIDKVKAWIENNLIPVIKAVGEWFGTVIGWVREHWAEISAVVQVAIDAVKGIIDTVTTAIKVLWDAFGTHIVAGITLVWETIKGVVQVAIDIVHGIIKTVVALIKGDWQAVWDGIKAIVSGVWDAIKLVVETAINAVKLVIETVMSAIKLALEGAWAAIKGVITAVWDAIKSAASTVWDAIKTSITAPITAARDVLAGVWTAIKDAASAVWEGLKTAASTAWEAIKSAITTPITMALASLGLAWTAIKDAASAVWEGLKTAASTAWEAIKGFITAPISAAATFIGDTWDAVVAIFTGIKDRVGAVFTGVADAVSGPFKAAFNFIASLWNNTVGKLSFRIPDWVPLIGGKGFDVPDIPTFHTGGKVGGAPGQESLALVMAGETIRTQAQERALGGGGSAGAQYQMVNHITVTAGPGADGGLIGRQIVDELARFTRQNGGAWITKLSTGSN